MYRDIQDAGGEKEFSTGFFGWDERFVVSQGELNFYSEFEQLDWESVVKG